MSVGGGSQSTTQKVEPPEVAQPHIKRALDAAQAEFSSGRPSYYPGQTYVPFAPETEAALGGQRERALQGSPLLQGAQDYTGGILSGQGLPQNNPYFKQMFDAVASEVVPQVNSSFAGAGRSGSGLHAQQLAKGLTQGFAPIAYQDYGRERGFMESAADRAPGLAREDYYDIGQLGNVGQAREGLAETALAADIDRFNFGQNVNQQKINQYANLAYGVPGSTSTGTQPTYRNPIGGLVGLASAGAQLGGAGGPFSSGGSVG